VRKYLFHHSNVVKLSTAFPTLKTHTELNTCITVFQFDLPWILRKTALETPATNPGGQATLKTSRTHRRKFQGNRKLGTKNHITDDTALTAGSHSRAPISLSSSYQLCKQNITIHTLPNKTTHPTRQAATEALPGVTHSEHFVSFRFDSALSGLPTVHWRNTPVYEPTKSAIYGT